MLHLSGTRGVDGVAHLPVLTPCLVHLLGGPTGGGPTLAALGEPHVPLLRQFQWFRLINVVYLIGLSLRFTIPHSKSE